jgi:hypothetical protein
MVGVPVLPPNKTVRDNASISPIIPITAVLVASSVAAANVTKASVSPPAPPINTSAMDCASPKATPLTAALATIHAHLNKPAQWSDANASTHKKPPVPTRVVWISKAIPTTVALATTPVPKDRPVKADNADAPLFKASAKVLALTSKATPTTAALATTPVHKEKPAKMEVVNVRKTYKIVQALAPTSKAIPAIAALATTLVHKDKPVNLEDASRPLPL